MSEPDKKKYPVMPGIAIFFGKELQGKMNISYQLPYLNDKGYYQQGKVYLNTWNCKTHTKLTLNEEKLGYTINQLQFALDFLIGIGHDILNEEITEQPEE